MKLQFDPSEISCWSKRYVDEMAHEKETTDKIIHEVIPSYKSKEYLTQEEFLIVCHWKSPRTEPRCKSNDEEYIKDVSALSLTTKSEHLKIHVWTLLDGVSWRTASVFLHFTYPDKYPILDYRALWSIQEEMPTKNIYEFWEKYRDFCKDQAKKAGVSMRELDQALWMYSKQNQKPMNK